MRPKFSSKARVTVLSIALSVSVHLVCKAEELNHAVRSKAAAALEAGSVFERMVSEDTKSERQESFRRALRDLVKEADEKTARLCEEREGDAMEYKIVVIALDYVKHPERYEEIARKYLYAPPSNQRTVENPTFPGLDRVHVNESYRLVWEYMLLWPETDDAINFRTLGAFHIGDALQALKGINSPKSQVLYEYCFEQEAKRDVVGITGTTELAPWFPLLEAMAQQHTSESLQRMLRSHDLLRPNQRFYGATRELLFSCLIGMEYNWLRIYRMGALNKGDYSARRAIRARWLDVIRKFPRENLSADHQALLKEVVEAPAY